MTDSRKGGVCAQHLKGCVCILSGWFILVYFQEVKFHMGCISNCENCTLNQMMSWSQTLTFSHNKNWVIVDFLGALQDVELKQAHGSSECVSVQFKWIQREEIEAKSDKLIFPTYRLDLTVNEAMSQYSGLPFQYAFKSYLDMLAQRVDESTLTGNNYSFVEKTHSSFHQPSFHSGYNLHFHIILFQEVKYFFAKYMDNTFTSSSEYKQYMQFDNASLSSFKLTYEWFDSYPYPDCPEIVHKPRLFSWNQALSFCTKQGHSILPEFIDVVEQQDFISAVLALKSMFPLEAVYIGAYKRLKVRPTRPSKSLLKMQSQTKKNK